MTIEIDEFQQRKLCLELAAQVSHNNAPDIINKAQWFWEWLNGSHEAAKAFPPRPPVDLNDDIPF